MLGRVGLVVGGISLTGCFSPGLFVVPRSIEPGTAQAGGSLETAGRQDAQTGAEGKLTPAVIRQPQVSARGRLGIAPRVDVGLAFAAPAPLFGATVDLKVQTTPSWYVDTAALFRVSLLSPWYRTANGPKCDPGFELQCRAIALLLLELIPMFGVNLGSRVTWVAAPGAFLRATPEPRLGYRLTTGLQWRVTGALAMHAELTYMPQVFVEPSIWHDLYAGLAVSYRGSDGYPR